MAFKIQPQRKKKNKTTKTQGNLNLNIFSGQFCGLVSFLSTLSVEVFLDFRVDLLSNDPEIDTKPERFTLVLRLGSNKKFKAQCMGQQHNFSFS